MRAWRVCGWVFVGALAGVVLGSLTPSLWAQSQDGPTGRMQLLGRHPNHSAALVNHAGELSVNCSTGCAGGSNTPVNQSGVWTVQAAHLAGVPSVSQGTTWSTLAHAQQSGTWTIQAAHQGGTPWTISHISSVVHLGGFIGLRDGLCATCWAIVDHTGALKTSATSTTDNVNVFHQSTVRHISSVTHVVIQQTQDAGASHLNVAPVYQAGTWTTQPGNTPNTTAWLMNMQHNSSVLHVAIRQGTGTGADHLLVAPVYQAGTWNTGILGRPNVGLGVLVTHTGQLGVTCFTNAGVAESCAGSGGSSDSVNVFHQSTIRHVSSITHVAGSLRLMSGTANDQLAVINHSGSLSITCMTASGVAESCGGGALPTAAALSDTLGNPTTPMIGAALLGTNAAGTTWIRVRVDSNGRIQVTDGGGIPMAVNVTQIGAAGISQGEGASTSGTQRVVLANNMAGIRIEHVSSVMHVVAGTTGKDLRTASFSLTATGTVVSAITGLRIRVYAVKLVASAAISVNFRDGGATNLEGAQALAINGGFVENINPPAFLFQTTAGNSLDLVISGVGTAAGRVSYFAE